VSRAVAVIALLYPLGVRVVLKRFPYLGNVSSEVLLIGHPVGGEASSGKVHGNWDVVYGSQGVREVELWRSLAVVESQLGSLEVRGIQARSHGSEELSGFDYCNGFVFQVLVVTGELLNHSFHHIEGCF